jgi:hypothetical protein
MGENFEFLSLASYIDLSSKQSCSSDAIVKKGNYMALPLKFLTILEEDDGNREYQ